MTPREAAASEALAAPGVPLDIETRLVAQDMAEGPGDAIACWAVRGNSVLGAARVAKRGIRAEALGAAVGEALDIHAADQMLIYLALAGGGAFTTCRLTRHARTAMWLIGQFLPVRFDTIAADDHVTVAVRANSDRA